MRVSVDNIHHPAKYETNHIPSVRIGGTVQHPLRAQRQLGRAGAAATVDHRPGSVRYVPYVFVQQGLSHKVPLNCLLLVQPILHQIMQLAGLKRVMLSHQSPPPLLFT